MRLLGHEKIKRKSTFYDFTDLRGRRRERGRCSRAPVNQVTAGSSHRGAGMTARARDALSAPSRCVAGQSKAVAGVPWIVPELSWPASQWECAWRAVQVADGCGLSTLRGDRCARGCLWVGEPRSRNRVDSTSQSGKRVGIHHVPMGRTLVCSGAARRECGERIAQDPC